MAALCPELTAEIDLLVQNLPQVLVACEHEWQAKLSFFMIVKGLVTEGEPGSNKFKKQLFEMFGRDMLIESLLRVEDSVRIVVTELLSEFLDNYFNDPNKLNYIDRILTNLTETLKMTDDVEGSVIFVFNLINKILNSNQFDIAQSKFRLDTSVFCPFNFHRVVSVRQTFNALIHRFLSINHFDWNDLVKFHSLTVQSLIMESDSELKRILAQNLKLIVS